MVFWSVKKHRSDDVIAKFSDRQQAQAVLNPESTIFGVGSLLGRSFFEIESQKNRKLLPFEIINVRNEPYIRVIVSGKKKVFSPVEIASMIFGG